MLSRLGRLALAAVLLAAWQAALLHPIDHVDELGEFVHVYGGHSHEGESKPGSLCDLLAALTACTAPTHAAFAHFEFQFGAPSYPSSAPRVAEAPPFLSQGPPVPV